MVSPGAFGEESCRGMYSVQCGQRLGTVETLSGKTSLHPSDPDISSPCRYIFETGVEEKVFIGGQMALDRGLAFLELGH